MKNIFLKDGRKKLIALGVGAAVFLALQILSATVLHKFYVFGWFADNFYGFTWVTVLILIAFGRTVISYFADAGIVLGAVVGEVLGGILWENKMKKFAENSTSDEYAAALQSHYGVLIAYIVFFAFLAIGIVVSVILSKKHSK